MNEFDLFQAALDLDDPVARQSFLLSTCGHDPLLLQRVEALLASHNGQTQFLSTPVVEQLTEVPRTDNAKTMRAGGASTQDDEPATLHAYPESAPMRPPQDDSDDEFLLGFLEPSTKPGSRGRLAHYEVLEVIGRGAFGTVLRAFDEKLQRVVAIKVMSPQIASTSPARRRFIGEARASAAIRHEHVVTVYSVDEEKSIPYLVMDYIPGRNLQQLLDERGPFDVPTVLRLGRQIAEGLAAAHAQDLIHRDVKPANILLESGAREMVKVTDFGLARAADDASVTQTGTIAGTPMYMAPEQASGKKLDQRADLFSFGSVLYQMVSGRPPFRAATTLAVLKRLNEDTPRPIREIIPETPQWLCDIISKLHEKNPAERYQSAREVANVLANCESQLKAHSSLRDFSLIPRTNTPPVTWWKWAAVIAILLPLLAIGLYALNRPDGQPKIDDQSKIIEPQEEPGAEPDKAVEATPIVTQETVKPETRSSDDMNSIGMEFVKVPKGKSWLGGHKNELGNREVEISDDFYLGKYEVTQEEWMKVMSDNPSYFSRTGYGVNEVADIKDADLKRHPVDSVTWDQCQLFIARLNKSEAEKGWTYRLPKEIEWEYACRGGPMAEKLDSAFDFYFAHPTNTLILMEANFNNGTLEDYVGQSRSSKVGSFAPNALGLHDMHGNLWEWCEDSDKTFEGESGFANRGGSWGSPPYECNATYRAIRVPTNVSQSHGVRLVRVPSRASP